MNKLILIGFLFLSSLTAPFATSAGQSDQEKETALNTFQDKIHQLEIFNMVLPVAMTKDQLRAVLKVVEKCHQRFRDVLDEEYKSMKVLAPQVDQAITDAYAKGAVPTQALVDKLYSASGIAVALRQGIMDDSVDDLYTTVTTVLNKGQLAAMANSLNPKEFPTYLKNPDKVSQEDKIRLFCRAIFLDHGAYEILVKLSV